MQKFAKIDSLRSKMPKVVRCNGLPNRCREKLVIIFEKAKNLLIYFSVPDISNDRERLIVYLYSIVYSCLEFYHLKMIFHYIFKVYNYINIYKVIALCV